MYKFSQIKAGFEWKNLSENLSKPRKVEENSDKCNQECKWRNFDNHRNTKE